MRPLAARTLWECVPGGTSRAGRRPRPRAPGPRGGTKVRIPPAELIDIPGAIARSLEASLRRLGREHVDLLQLHNPITATAHPRALPATEGLDAAAPALSKLVAQGKTRFFGITALGDTAALHQVLDAGALDTA